MEKMHYRFGPAIVMAAWFGLFQSALAEEAPGTLSDSEPAYLINVESDASAPVAKLPEPPTTTNQTVAESAALKDVKVYPSF